MEALRDAGALDDAKEIRKLERVMRSTLWTLRCVFKNNDLAETNVLEIKRMVPTLAPEGVVST